MRALLVDDDPVIHLLTATYLAGIPNFHLATAERAEEVLDRLNRGEKVDWLLVDWNLGGMNGCEMVGVLRADPRFGHLRIMMLTTKNSMEDVKKALAAGANEYLMKPFTKEMLLGKLDLLSLEGTTLWRRSVCS